MREGARRREKVREGGGGVRRSRGRERERGWEERKIEKHRNKGDRQT